MRQVVRLDAGSGRLEFHCQVDWRESNTMLKVLFPVDVLARNATYQTQFGYTGGPPTVRRVTTSPATRCRATASPTCRSMASAWPS